MADDGSGAEASILRASFCRPAVIFFAIFFLYPIVIGFGLSLTDFTLLKPPVWVGLQNYQDLLNDRLFLKSLNVTIGFVLGSTVPVWFISLAMAVLFFQRFPGRELMKVLFFTPLLPSVVVVSVIWKLLLHPSGILSSVIGPNSRADADQMALSICSCRQSCRSWCMTGTSRPST